MDSFLAQLRSNAVENDAVSLESWIIPLLEQGATEGAWGIGPEAPPLTLDLREQLAPAAKLTSRDIRALVDAVIMYGVPVFAMLFPNHDIGDEGLAHLCRLLSTSEGYKPTLEHLDVSSNHISAFGVIPLSQCISQPACTLRVAALNGNDIGHDGGRALASALETSRELRVLEVANCDLDTTAVIAMSAVMRDQSSLVGLKLDNPRLFSRQEDTGKHIARMIKTNPQLQMLSLRKHRLGDLGASLIAQALETNMMLVALDLSCNQISITGAEAISSLLMQHHRVEEIDLSHNAIGNEGAKAIGLALSRNRSLRKLRMTHCSIKDEGLCAVASGLEMNTTLTLLRLWGNDFDQPSLEHFEGLCRDRFPHTDTTVDIQVYAVDGVRMVAQQLAESDDKRYTSGYLPNHQRRT